MPDAMAVQVTIYLNEADQWHHRPLHVEILNYLRQENVYAAIALHAVAFVVFVAFGASKGSAANLPPLFTHGGFVSVLLVMQVVPYYMTGYESVAKAAEERSPGFSGRGFFTAIWMAIVVGILFYTIVIAAVACAATWSRLTG